MDFHNTVAGKQFFGVQIPKLITALSDIAASLKAPKPVFHMKEEVPPDFLTKLYYGQHDPLEPTDTSVFHTYNANIIACQEQMRKLLTPETWELVEQYKSLLDARGAVEREQAFSAGFQYATKLFAAGLSTPQSEGKLN